MPAMRTGKAMYGGERCMRVHFLFELLHVIGRGVVIRDVTVCTDINVEAFLIRVLCGIACHVNPTTGPSKTIEGTFPFSLLMLEAFPPDQ
jgi:hypothetical protein